MLGRRLLLLVAVLMGLTALAASVAPRQPAPGGSPSPAPTREPAAPPVTPEAGPAADGGIVEATVSAARGARPAHVQASVGDIVRLEVTGDLFDAVELQGGLDLVDGIAPEAPARFELLADRPGTYPIALYEERRRVGELEITAAP